MATALDLNTVTQALKEHYKDLRVKNMVYKDNPLLALMPKYEQFGGENMPIPTQYGIANRRSATFGTGQALDTATSLARFVLTRVKDYSFASITGESIKATESNADAFLKYATLEIDGAIQSLTRSIAIGLYGDGSGKIGQVGSTTGTSGTQTITLSNVEEITNFEVGMVLRIATNTTSALETDVLTISEVDRDLGTIKVVITSSSGNLSAGDALFQSGDYVSASDRLKICLLGTLSSKAVTTFQRVID
jgi:hypothetical protein